MRVAVGFNVTQNFDILRILDYIEVQINHIHIFKNINIFLIYLNPLFIIFSFFSLTIMKFIRILMIEE